MSIVLEVTGLTSGYGDVTVLRDVDLALPGGSVAAILGPNGAGKTTLLYTLAGLIRPQAGRIQLQGSDTTSSAAHERVKQGFCLIPEGRGVFRNLTVAENLRLQLPPWERDTVRIERAYESLPVLKGMRKQRAGSLSGGQQQMVALARCFVAQPAVVAVDEVSMGLSPRIIDDIFAALRLLVADGIALLLVEQYVTRALAVADTAYLINRGRVTFSGPASEIDESRLLADYLGVAPE